MDMDAIAPMAGLVSIEIPALIVLGGVESFIEDGETASELPQPPVTRAASLSEETPMIRRGLRTLLAILESPSMRKRGGSGLLAVQPAEKLGCYLSDWIAG
jgi:hypothetical protein